MHSLPHTICDPQVSLRMASSLALKKLVSSNLLPKSLLSNCQTIPAAQSASRLFNTKAVREYQGVGFDDDRCFEATFSALRESQRQLKNPTFSGLGRSIYVRESARETEDCLYLRMLIPGYGKENVKIIVEQNTLTIECENMEESGEGDSGQGYYSKRIDLADKVYRTDQIKAELKNGLLKVEVPKVKDEERSDMFQVTIEYKNG